MRFAKWFIALGLVLVLAPAAFAGNARGGGAQKSQLYTTSDAACTDQDHGGFTPGTHTGDSIGFVILNSNGKPLNNVHDLIANIQLMDGTPTTVYTAYVCSRSFAATGSNGSDESVSIGMITTDARGHGHDNIHVLRADTSSANPDGFYVELKDMTTGATITSDILNVD